MINVPTGAYNLSADFGELVIDDTSGKVTIQSVGGVAAIDARSTAGGANELTPFRVLQVGDGSEVELIGLAITGGKAPNGGDGGGILSTATLTLTDSTVSHNYAGEGADEMKGGDGGGIYSTGPLDLTNSTVTQNAAGNGSNATGTDSAVGGSGGSGGGIYNVGPLALTNSSVSQNTAGHGGDAVSSAFSQAGSGGNGGGVCSEGTLEITNSIIDSNIGGNGGDATGSFDNIYAGVGGGGGGIFTGSNVALTVTQSTVSNNAGGDGGSSIGSEYYVGPGGDGGGIYAGGTVIVTKSTIRSNAAGRGGNSNPLGYDGVGGGICAPVGAPVTLTESTVSDNSGRIAGGVLTQGEVMITDCAISDNTALDYGGGVVVWANGGSTTRLSIRNSTISGNSAIERFGGGIVTNAIVGAIIVNLHNSTIADNTAAAGEGGGIRRLISGGSTSLIVAHNTIIAGNTGDDIHGEFGSTSSFNLIGDGTGGLTNGTNGNQAGTLAAPIDARLGPLGNNGGPTQTHALLPDSPALEAGDPAFDPNVFNPPLTTDQRGLPRVADSDGVGAARLDIGAVEFAAVNSPPDAVADGATTSQDTAVFVDVLDNDTDPDGDSMSIASVTPAAHGAVVLNADQTVTYTPNAGYFGSDSFTYIATDGETDSEPATVTIDVSAAAPGTIKLRSDGDLVINGSDASDLIGVARSNPPGKLIVGVYTAGVLTTTDVDVPSGRIFIFGHGGNDGLGISPNGVSNIAWLDGDAGNDALALGTGGGIAFGGADDDYLYGGNARDVLVGGAGRDTLTGNGGDDVLVSSATDHDDRFTRNDHDVAWSSIRAEWTRTGTNAAFAQRVANLRDGSGSANRLNGSSFLSLSTVHDDGAIDSLIGNAGDDWYIYRAGGGNDRASDITNLERTHRLLL